MRLNDLLKYLLTPEKCGNWPFVFVCEMDDVIKQIKANNLIARPFIPRQTAEGKVLARVITKCPHILKTEDLCNEHLNQKFIIQFLNRDEAIKDWPADTLKEIMQQVLIVKDFFWPQLY